MNTDARADTGESDAHAASADDWFERAPVALWVCCESSGAILAANAQALARHGRSRAGMLAAQVSDIVADGLPALAPDVHERRHVAARLRGIDGESAPAELSLARVSWRGRPALLVHVHESAVPPHARPDDRRFRDLFEHSLGLMCAHALDGTLLSVNPAAAAALGYRVEELLGTRLSELVPAAQRPLFDDYLERIARRGDDAGLLCVTHRCGALRVWRYHNRLYRDDIDGAVVMGSAQDVTERRRYERRLREQQAELKAVTEAVSVGLCHIALDGTVTYANRRFEALLGPSAHACVGAHWTQMLDPAQRSDMRHQWARAVAAHQPLHARLRLQEAPRTHGWIEVEVTPVAVDHDLTGYVVLLEDIAPRQRALRQLRESQRRLSTIADAMPAMIGYIDPQQRFVFANAAYVRTYGRGRSSVIGSHVREILGDAIYARRRPYVERALRGERVTFEDEEETSDALPRCMQVTYIPQWDERHERVLGMHAMVQDVTQAKLRERRLRQVAKTDSLTGLANRAGLLEQLEQALQQVRSDDRPLALMFVDIDHFKDVNDRHGHAAGDALLQAFCQRLCQELAADDIAGRLGGDEFAVILRSARTRRDAAAAATRIVRAMQRPFALEPGGAAAQVTASIGLAFADQTAPATASELLEQADVALYAVKESGRNGYRIYGEKLAPESPAVAKRRARRG